MTFRRREDRDERDYMLDPRDRPLMVAMAIVFTLASALFPIACG